MWFPVEVIKRYISTISPNNGLQQNNSPEGGKIPFKAIYISFTFQSKNTKEILTACFVPMSAIGSNIFNYHVHSLSFFCTVYSYRYLFMYDVLCFEGIISQPRDVVVINNVAYSLPLHAFNRLFICLCWMHPKSALPCYSWLFVRLIWWLFSAKTLKNNVSDKESAVKRTRSAIKHFSQVRKIHIHSSGTLALQTKSLQLKICSGF